MKIINTFAIIVVFLAVACVGMHLYIVEAEINDVRQTQSHQDELNNALEAANHAIVFASETQYIAVMAEERACELAAKLDTAGLIAVSLEEQLEQATSVVESQCEQIRDLIDLNSELQTDSVWQDEEMDRILADRAVLEGELIDALRVAEDHRLALVEVRRQIDVAETVLSMRDIQLEQANACADGLSIELQQTKAQLELTTVQLTDTLAEQTVLQARLDEALAAIKRFRAYEVLK